jgi:transposase
MKGTKVVVVSNDDSLPLQLGFAPGGQHDIPSGRPVALRLKPGIFLTADRGFDDKKLRQKLRQQGIKPIIPKRRTSNKLLRRIPKPNLYQKRFKIERFFGWTDQYRALVTRYERLDPSYEAFCTLVLLSLY